MLLSSISRIGRVTTQDKCIPFLLTTSHLTHMYISQCDVSHSCMHPEWIHAQSAWFYCCCDTPTSLWHDICREIDHHNIMYTAMISGYIKSICKCSLHSWNDFPTGLAERLAKLWRISEDDAQRTVEQTTQLGRNSANTTLSREFSTNNYATRFYTNTMFVTGKAKSTRGYTCVQVYVSDKGFRLLSPDEGDQ